MALASASAFEFRAVTKRFGAVTANDSVSFAVERGTIHGVVGENGAGKSTIMKVLYGLYGPDAGEIYVDGKPVTIKTPHEAIALGIGMVHQHFMLVPTLPVWQNVILGGEPTLGRLNREAILEKLDALQTAFGFALDLAALTETLAVGHQQQVEILKLLYREANILILDEPTAVLTPQEVEALFQRLRALRDAGRTIVLISHKLNEILGFTQTVTVMRRGRAVVPSLPTAGLDHHALAEHIVGRPMRELPERKHGAAGKPIVEVRDLRLPGKLDGLTFSVRAGEIVGIAGVEGNGQQELIECLANVRRRYEGEVRFDGRPLRDTDTYHAKQNGLAVIPPDRHREACVLDFTVAENFILGHHREDRYKSRGLLSTTRTAKAASEAAERFDVRPRDVQLPIRALSGGNQQKVIIGREISGKVKFLIAAHPTRGVDIGAIELIHAQCLALRDEGAGVLLISSELDEILALADRILVLYEGRFTGEITRDEADILRIGSWMTGATA